MDWGTVELEPEVRDWLESLSTSQFARAAFYIGLLAERGPVLGSRTRASSPASCGSTSTVGRCD